MGNLNTKGAFIMLFVIMDEMPYSYWDSDENEFVDAMGVAKVDEDGCFIPLYANVGTEEFDRIEAEIAEAREHGTLLTEDEYYRWF